MKYRWRSLTDDQRIKLLLQSKQRLHPTHSPFQWNGAEQTRGRQVWCKAMETSMKSQDHYWATLIYVHHNLAGTPTARLTQFTCNSVNSPVWQRLEV
jgi:hypothetical protein